MVGSPSMSSLDDDDAGVLVRLRPVHAEHHPQIGERHDAAAHVDQAVDEGRGVGHLGDRHQIEDFADALGLDGEDFVLQPQGERRHGAA